MRTKVQSSKFKENPLEGISPNFEFRTLNFGLSP
jgi:hypothetical protein